MCEESLLDVVGMAEDRKRPSYVWDGQAGKDAGRRFTLARPELCQECARQMRDGDSEHRVGEGRVG